MTEMIEKKLKYKYKSIFPYLNEKQKRIIVASDAKVIGYGGISQVSRSSGISRPTIHLGMSELEKDETETIRIRKSGGGRKKKSYLKPTLLKELEALVEPLTKGDPMSPLRWTCKSIRNLSEELSKKVYKVGKTIVAEMLHELDYNLQANTKSIEGKDHPDRDKQFHYINKKVNYYLKRLLPVISVDAKKKELIGKYKNNGKEWHKKGKPQRVNVHDFPDKELGKAIPYGVYDVHKNFGWVNVGCDSDTASFAVESIRRWWRKIGKKSYPKSQKLLICADAGGSNSYRNRLWKFELQRFANEIGLEITVNHFPPGTSKWNKIEHRLFSFISMNWRGKPLISHEVVVNLIGATKNRKGLKVKATFDKNKYPTKIKISNEEFSKINLKPHRFHGEWNYTIKPSITMRHNM